ncbi:MAG: O-antigen ligase family protein [Marinifilaceae bacterium]|jgi:O-antigen ligase|nr:O-antigen ligase family protein [Marinifilaceae bacterium]
MNSGIKRHIKYKLFGTNESIVEVLNYNLYSLANLSLVSFFVCIYFPGTNNLMRNISLVSFLISSFSLLLKAKKPVFTINSQNIYLIIIPIYYLLGFIYFFVDTDISRMFWEQERKLALFFVPLVLVFFDKKEVFKSLLNALVFGGFVSFVIVLYLCHKQYGFSLNEHFFTRFNAVRAYHYAHHVSFNILLNFSIIAILYKLTYQIKNILIIPKIFYIILFVVFSLILLNGEGRMGLLSYVGIVISFISIWIFRKKKKIFFISLFILLVAGISLVSLNPRLKNISIENVQKQTIPDYLPRVYIWKTAFKLIKERPILGYGIGTTKDKLLEQYKKDGYRAGVIYTFHSHNQFLQSWLQFGVLGLLLSLIILLYPLYYYLYKNRNELILLLWLAFFMANITEPMLQISFGIFPFCILIIMMVCCDKKRPLGRIR